MMDDADCILIYRITRITSKRYTVTDLNIFPFCTFCMTEPRNFCEWRSKSA